MIAPTGPDADPATADDALALQVGYLGLWKAWQPGLNPAYGLTEQLESTSLVQVSAGQATYGQVRPGTRGHRLRWDYLSDADKKMARDIQKQADVLRPLYFCLNPESTDGIVENYLGRFLQLGEIESNVFERYAATLALTEWKA